MSIAAAEIGEGVLVLMDNDSPLLPMVGLLQRVKAFEAALRKIVETGDATAAAIAKAVLAEFEE